MQKKVNKQAVLDILKQAEVAYSHQEIQAVLGDACNRVTTYRVLDKLLEEGKIHKIVDTNGVSKFASCHSCSETQHHTHNHIHFSCTQCNEVTCLENLKPTVEIPSSYTVSEMNIVLSGICSTCNSKS